VVTSFSPAGAAAGGPAFVLAVNGSGFVAGVVVKWNGTDEPTTFLSDRQLTAQIPASAIASAAAAEITVVNPAPGGGAAGPLTFCTTAAPGPASGQSLARLGAYFFDGWSGPLTNFHFAGLVDGPYADREPLSGWQDGSSCAVEQQLAWAHRFGLSFFVFDWYANAISMSNGEDLNSAFKLTRALADRHGMKYAIYYVNSGPFIVDPSDWRAAVDEWIVAMTEPDYLLVDGKPYLAVGDSRQMRQTFGSSAAVADALDQLRAAARSHGLPGVYVVGGFTTYDDAPSQDGLFTDLSAVKADGYDAAALYTYAWSAPFQASGMLPLSDLADLGKWTWSEAAARSPLPFIPVVDDGWDPRPWGENETGRAPFWFGRSAEGFAGFVADAITWAESTPRLRLEPSPAPPLVLIEAWNELGEGSYLAPTVGEGTSYGDALATMLATPPARARTQLSLSDSGAAQPARSASGALTDGTGAPIANATIAILAAPAAGAVAPFHLSGLAPGWAKFAVVGFRVNSDDPDALWPGYFFAGPHPSSFSLYRMSYVQPSDGIERLPNGDFAAGASSWTLRGGAALAPSDGGAGQMLRVQVVASQLAALDSAAFPVTGGAPFELSISARVAPSSLGSGYFMVAFEDASLAPKHIPAEEPSALPSLSLPLTPGMTALGTAKTDANGNYHLDLAALGTSPALIEASYAGDASRWPASARTGP
jgi:hypothetical protein